MNNKKLFFKINRVGFVLAAVLLTTLTECAGYADGLHIGIVVPPVVVVAPPVVVAAPVVVVQDDYVYYPNYEVYYSSNRHQYAYLEDGAWVSAPAPYGVSVDVLLASPSVRMDFHDSPAKHHAEIARQYPRDWKPSGSDQGQNRKDDKHDDHRDNNGR